MGRPDLPAALAFAREQMPDGARYYARTRSPSVGCLMLNLFPREPVRSVDFDRARDWLVLDGVAPKELGTADLRDQARQTSRQVTGSPADSFVLIPPEGFGG
jgi:hypothetical protein